MVDRNTCRLLISFQILSLSFVSLRSTSIPTLKQTPNLPATQTEMTKTPLNLKQTPTSQSSTTMVRSTPPKVSTMSSSPEVTPLIIPASTTRMSMTRPQQTTHYTTLKYKADLNCSGAEKNISQCIEEMETEFNYWPLLIGLTVGGGIVLISVLIVGALLLKRRRSSVPRLPPPKPPPRRAAPPKDGMRSQTEGDLTDDKQSVITSNGSTDFNDMQHSYLDIMDGNTQHVGDQLEWELFLATEALQNDLTHLGVYRIPIKRTSTSLWFAHTANFAVSGRELYDMARRMKNSSGSDLETYSGPHQPIVVGGKSYMSSETPWPLSESQLGGVRDLGASKKVILRIVKHLEYLVIGVAPQYKEAELHRAIDTIRNSL